MRSLCSIFFALALLLTSCQREEIVRGTSELTISLPATRTSLGEKVGVTYPVYWSEGDKISANGVESSEALIDENNPSRAQFSFLSVVNYPLNILYPSGSKVTFAAEQSYVEGTFAEGSAPMCGYAASASEPIQMRHLAGVLRFAVKANSEVLLDKIVITSERSIAGEFDVDIPENDSYREVQELSDALTAQVEIRVKKRSRAGEQGEVAIHFGSLDELNGLLEKLGLANG
jgi:hypothetical protein